jgi:hypothetical protein
MKNLALAQVLFVASPLRPIQTAPSRRNYTWTRVGVLEVGNLRRFYDP